MPIAAIMELVAEILAIAPQAISVGLDVTNLIAKARAALTAVNAPADVDWQSLDQQVSALEAQLNTDPAAPAP